MKHINMISVKDAILGCDLAALQNTVADRLHIPPGALRQELDEEATGLVRRISMTLIECDPSLVTICYPVKADREWNVQTAIYRVEEIELDLRPIGAYDNLEAELFPGDDLETFGELDIELQELPGLLALCDRMPLPVNWTLLEWGMALSAGILYEDSVTRRLIAGDILSEYLVRHGFFTAGGMDRFLQRKNAVPDREFDDEMWISNMKEDVYNQLSRYHELWKINDILFESEKGGDAGCDASNAEMN